MPKNRNLKEAYDSCLSDGFLIPQKNIDVGKIEAMLIIAEEEFKAAHELQNTKHPPWNTIYKLYYDTLHLLAESFLRFDKIKSSSHRCLFAYLCQQHTELDFDWAFFEKVRTKRNGINYYGTPVTHEDWKDVEVQIQFYIKILRKEIESKIKKAASDC